MNVYEFAMQMEEDGYEYYLKLADATTAPGLKTIFTDLARDEKKHYSLFRDLREGKAARPPAESGSLETAKNIFRSLAGDPVDTADIPSILDGYRHAMELEAKSYEFYVDAARKEPDEEVKEVLMKIAAEEQDHFNILENVYNFVNAPNQNLEWAEFSNIGEFSQFGRDPD